MPQNKTFDELQAELKALEVEEARFRVEELRIRSAQREQEKNNKQRLSTLLTEDARRSEAMDRAKKQTCTHRQGGLDYQGLLNGNDTSYSVWKHTYPLGDTWILCSRCGSEWKPGDTAATHSSGIGYDEAVKFPTTNTTSTSVTFTVRKRA